MFDQEKMALLLAGSLPGSRDTLPAALAAMATDGLQRVVRPYLKDFVEISLMVRPPIQSSHDEHTLKEFYAAARGHYKQFPLAVALARLSVSPADAALDIFFGHLVMARLTYVGTHHDELLAAGYSAGLALRKFMDIGRPDVLSKVVGTDDPLDLANHRKRLLKWRADEATEATPIPGLRRAIEDLERFHAYLAVTRTPKPGRERNKNVHHEGAAIEVGDSEPMPTAQSPSPVSILPLPQAPIIAARPMPDPDKHQDDDAHVLSPEKPRAIISRERAEEALHLGEPTAEGVDQFDIRITNESLPISRPFALPRQRLPAGHFEVRARRAATQDLALANPATLRFTDIELLVATLTRDHHSLAIKSVIAAALFGGQLPSKLLEWQVASHIEGLDFTTTKSVVVLEPFGLLVPLEATKGLPKAPEDTRSKIAPAVFLPWNTEWRGLRALRALAETRIGTTLFNAIDLESAAKIIKQLSAQQTTALTLRRISTLLSRRIRDASEDLVIEALITGNTLNVNESARMHYFQTTVEELASFYWKQANALHLELRGQVANERMPELLIYGTIGSQRCPDREAVKVWVSNFLGRVGTPPRGRPSVRSVSAFHATYTAYVIENLMWASGVRPHGKGLACLEPVRSMFLVDEKSKGVAALRQIPLSVQASTQWAHYQVHRKWVMHFLGLQHCPIFFSVNDKGKVKPLTFGEVRSVSECSFATNANRHYFCTSLRRAGMTGAEVNALMGHATLGEELGNRYGAWDLRKLFAKCTKAIDMWMDADGWLPREGFGRG